MLPGPRVLQFLASEAQPCDTAARVFSVYPREKPPSLSFRFDERKPAKCAVCTSLVRHDGSLEEFLNLHRKVQFSISKKLLRRNVKQGWQNTPAVVAVESDRA